RSRKPGDRGGAPDTRGRPLPIGVHRRSASWTKRASWRFSNTEWPGDRCLTGCSSRRCRSRRPTTTATPPCARGARTTSCRPRERSALAFLVVGRGGGEAAHELLPQGFLHLAEALQAARQPQLEQRLG